MMTNQFEGLGDRLNEAASAARKASMPKGVVLIERAPGIEHRIDEISKGLKDRYASKAAVDEVGSIQYTGSLLKRLKHARDSGLDVQAAMAKHRLDRETRNIHNRHTGIKRAVKEDNIEELSKDTLTRYKDAAHHDRVVHDLAGGLELRDAERARSDKSRNGHLDRADKHSMLAIKRKFGIHRADRRLSVKEDVADFMMAITDGSMQLTEDEYNELDTDMQLLYEVAWRYRSGIGHGTIVSVVKKGKDRAHTEFKLRVSASDRAKHKGEPQFRNHFGSDFVHEMYDEDADAVYVSWHLDEDELQETENQLNELSRNTLQSYMRKSELDGDRAHNRSEIIRRKTREEHTNWDQRKAYRAEREELAKRQNKRSAGWLAALRQDTKKANESVDESELDELSNSTLSRYIAGATHDRNRHLRTREDDVVTKHSLEKMKRDGNSGIPDATLDKHIGNLAHAAHYETGNVHKRNIGVAKARDKIIHRKMRDMPLGTGIERNAWGQVTEDELDELSTGTLKRYVGKSLRSSGKLARDYLATDDPVKQDVVIQKQVKRDRGTGQAIRHMQSHSVRESLLTEISLNSKRQYAAAASDRLVSMQKKDNSWDTKDVQDRNVKDRSKHYRGIARAMKRKPTED